MNTEEAVSVLREALESDEELFFAWQSNIAAGFIDAYKNEVKQEASPELSRIANVGAKYFLNNLIGK